VRINPQNLSVRENGGESFDLLAHLQTLQTTGPAGEWIVRLPATVIEGRVCALRKSQEAMTKPETWEFAKWVAVFTGLSTPAETILEW